MRTRSEVLDIISTKLINAKIDSLTFDDIKTFVDNAPIADQNLLVDYIKAKNYNNFGKFFMKMFLANLKSSTDATASNMILNDNITVQNLQRIL